MALSNSKHTIGLMVKRVQFVVVLFCGIFQTHAEHAFTHPGIFNSQAELDNIRAIVLDNKTDPIDKGWDKLLQSSLSKTSYTASPYVDIKLASNTPEKTALRNDGRAIYSHALQWAVTGDKKYADKSIEIMNAWANKLTKFSAGSGASYIALVSSWNIHIWMAGAEIIRYYERDGVTAGWSQSDIAQFEKMCQVFKTAITGWSGTPKSQVSPNYSGNNCALSIALSRMSLGIFLDDESLYNDGKDHLLKEKMWSWLSGTLIEYSIGDDGEVYEINRDCGHAGYNADAFILDAELLWHQGVDLYDMMFEGESVPRIFKGTEYFAKATVDPPVKTSFIGNETCKGPSGSQEVAYNHYKNRLEGKYPIVHMDDGADYVRPTGDGVGGGKFLPWTTLTHADLSKDMQSKVVLNSAKLKSSVFTAKINGSGALILSYNGADKGAQVKIFNLSGKLVKSLFISKRVKLISLKGLNSGLYFVEFELNGVCEAKKILLNK